MEGIMAEQQDGCGCGMNWRRWAITILVVGIIALIVAAVIRG